MNKIFHATVLLFFVSVLLAQQKPALPSGRGITPMQSEKQSGERGSKYAVVVGISDYQDPGIPDLRFADKDAEAFANYLRSPAGGSLDKNHLQVLTNQNATAGRIAGALDNLIEQAKESDEVIIYFSGHGDVEGKKISQPGFLLCWDAPNRVYMGGGTYSLSFLQEVITTLSIQNKAKVVVITDACHAGKLAGSQIGGAQLTSANLAKQYANEVKILSCQPGEFSLEGEQWGGGRGLFSYYLIDALYGLADRNADGKVSLGEIDRYLEDHVTAEAAPQSQVPMLLGNKTEQLTTVNAKILSDLKTSKSGELLVFAMTEVKGLEEEVLSKEDSSIQEIYRAFKLAVQEKRFLAPAGNCAEDFYGQLIQVDGLAALRGIMKRNYAAALQDDAQQVLNEWLRTGRNQTLEAGIGTGQDRLPRKVFTEKVSLFPQCLDRAADLLGSKHYMYAALKARAYFFKGYLLANSNQNPDSALGGRALSLFRKSLEWQPDQPQVYWEMGIVFACNLLQPDSLEHYARMCISQYPNWTRPYWGTAHLLSKNYKQFDRASHYLEQASHLDSNSAELWVIWAALNFSQKNFGQAELNLRKAIQLDSSNPTAWNNLGFLYISTRRTAEAEIFFKKAITLDSTNANAFSNLGFLYNQNRRYSEAELVLKKAIGLNSENVTSWNNLGVLYYWTKRYAEAETAYNKAITLDSTVANSWTNLGSLYNITKRHAEAELSYKKAILLDSTVSNFWNNLGFLYNQSRRYLEAEPVFKKAIALDSTDPNAWNNLGFVYNMTLRSGDAELAFKKAISLDSFKNTYWSNLGSAYLNLHRYTEAEQTSKKSIALDSTSANPRRHLGMVYFKTNRPEEARQNFLKAIELNPNYTAAKLGMAYLLAAEGKTGDALSYVEQAIVKGITFEQLEKDEDLAPLRKIPEWIPLMKKHFPDKVKE